MPSLGISYHKDSEVLKNFKGMFRTLVAPKNLPLSLSNCSVWDYTKSLACLIQTDNLLLKVPHTPYALVSETVT